MLAPGKLLMKKMSAAYSNAAPMCCARLSIATYDPTRPKIAPEAPPLRTSGGMRYKDMIFLAGLTRNI